MKEESHELLTFVNSPGKRGRGEGKNEERIEENGKEDK